MKDLGLLGYFPGLEVSFSSEGYYLPQAKYVFDLLSISGIIDSISIIASTLLNSNVKSNSTSFSILLYINKLLAV